MTHSEMVKEFHRIYSVYISDKPELPKQETRDLRVSLLKEEWNEYLLGEFNDDLVEIADALGDMLYIIHGTAISYGIPLDKVFDEIHRSNKSKLGDDGQPIYREDGKVLKGPNFFSPDVAGIIEASDRKMTNIFENK